jgi:hypothetical protein
MTVSFQWRRPSSSYYEYGQCHISEKGGLRDGLAVGQARDIIWIFNDPTLHHVLVRQRRWSQDRYRDWLTDSLQRQLLG